jgi:hypothetical protein
VLKDQNENIRREAGKPVVENYEKPRISAFGISLTQCMRYQHG